MLITCSVMDSLVVINLEHNYCHTQNFAVDSVFLLPLNHHDVVVSVTINIGGRLITS